MKIVRDYLTSEELIYIVNAMLEKETAVEREIVKVALVAQLLAEDIGEFEDCNDVYDKVVADDTINLSAIVNNYDVIDKLVAEEMSIEKILKDFVNNIEERLKSMKDIDFNSVLSQLKEISEKGDVEKDGKHKIQQSPRNRKVSK